MIINEKITKVNKTVMTNKKNKYIVVHYVGSVSTAKNNANYFYSVNRGASANYFVDDNEIWRVVKDKDMAWHCGTKKTYYHKECRNNNSIGVEMCCIKKNGKLDISDKTVNNTIELVRDLMKKYDIPVENVIRHYDVTRKKCPAPFVSNKARWEDFKAKLVDKPKLKIERIETKTIKLKVDANLWDLDFTNIKDAKSVKQYKKGDTIGNIMAVATHTCGSKYYMTAYSYNNGINNGFNIVDCEDYTRRKCKHCGKWS
jgi:N-acetylmuramoyl-L-alanine amidase CwlA